MSLVREREREADRQNEYAMKPFNTLLLNKLLFLISPSHNITHPLPTISSQLPLSAFIHTLTTSYPKEFLHQFLTENIVNEESV